MRRPGLNISQSDCSGCCVQGHVASDYCTSQLFYSGFLNAAALYLYFASIPYFIFILNFLLSISESFMSTPQQVCLVCAAEIDNKAQVE